MLEDLLLDLKIAARQMAANPGFAATAILTLALGIGANTAIFTLVNGTLMRPPAVEQPERLVWLTMNDTMTSRVQNLSYPDYQEYAGQTRIFSGLAGYDDLPVSLSGAGEPERTRGQIVTGNYFGVLGVRAATGRTITPADDITPGAHPVVVISHALWTRRFGADAAAIGSRLKINGHPYTVIGVAPDHFTGLEMGEPPDLWVPLAMHAQMAPGLEANLAARDAAWLRVVGRLAPGVGLSAARAGLTAVSAAIEQAWPGQHEGRSIGVTGLAGSLHPSNKGEAIPAFAMLMAITGIVLLIACGNVASLLLARGAGRRREIGVRLSLGATRGRLIRQLVTESLLLSLLGAAAGLIVAFWATDLLMVFAEAPAEISRSLAPDYRVVLFALGLAVASGLIFGLAPALRASRGDLVTDLKDDSTGSAGSVGKSRLLRLLVSGQAALCLLLLAGAGLFLSGLRATTAAETGFDVKNGLAITFDLSLAGHTPEESRLLCADLLERVKGLPGVASASIASLVPLSGKMLGMGVTTEATGGGGSTEQIASMNSVWPGFFATMGIPLSRGRDFGTGDGPGAPGAAIVSETAARRLWPGEEPLGKRLSLNGEDGPWLTVIGVAGDAKQDELNEDPRTFVYLSHFQQPGFLSDLNLVVRGAGDVTTLIPAVKREIRAIDPDLPLSRLSTLEGYIRLRLDKQRAITRLLTLFGLLSLLLASVGLYGLMAFSVAQRTREIGIRMALGALPRDLMVLFVKEGVRLSLLGAAVGLVPAVVLARMLTSAVFGLGVVDLLTLSGVLILLTLVAAAASYFPARRAASADPMLALRHS